jgi:hypothetical protein
MTITDRDIREQVFTAVNANGEDLAEGIDVEAITQEIMATYGRVDIDTIDTDEFWALVRKHDATQQD